ncbi:MAG: UDP-N-acetylmuramate-L-alanine ligase [Candidatus Gottesmanbacteria bacterium GW2011_GWB1_44_11c]|uniref:UDP-N-acetylmuramate--L-alanine ligase n=2 Tax=Candidatus Gottesmaniibacteriota TaxID=1752720 RepID=A0A0G1IQB6_9BACT|nr:MAG: UDP-N-acetylmuramate-L-alanine ligase [Candidatus Gottesmanbacteria bacterium GW2011_GWB1_44_11c]KKT61340.1 MAG: UDP-N-acetylmuramate-L-alanine ligase [Candidatus Gottesmanbacteria bacterium GW2011_GWA1_44_24b]HCM82888.1 UDP-N-acetylmuramate--L-alanine ligase [Patescibacteria group bacterium]
MDIHASKLRFIHFVGIKGVAMTALAIYCKEKRMTVTGSDVEEDFPTKESLEKNGIVPYKGFSADHLNLVNKPDLVVFTGAHGGCDNIEAVTAKRLGIEIMPHGRALGFFMDGSVQVSVAGSHGKTTTSAMIATIFSNSHKDPSYAIGCGDIRGLGYAGHFGKGREFIAEADEYVTDPTHDPTPRFLWQRPHVLVVTNIDYDHPDVYKSLDQVKNAFISLKDQEEGIAVTIVNADDPNSSLLLHGKEILTYGFSGSSDFRITNVTYQQGKTIFEGSLRGMAIEPFALRVPGKHNVLNAAAAICACYSLGISWEDILHGISLFEGTKRRFELIGESANVTVFDDYAHHPREIEATLEGIRLWYPHTRIITIFQPHTFSRTKALFSQFGTCFTKSDIVCIADIYASAREQENLGVTSKILVEEISKHQKDVYYVKDLGGTITFLKKHKKEGDIILCMGAGDIYGWGNRIVQELRVRS